MSPLVDYSEDEDEEHEPLPAVRLPHILINPYIKDEEYYSVHASLNWVPDLETAAILQLAVPQGFQSLVYSDLKAPRALHVSITDNVSIPGKSCGQLLSEMRNLSRSLGLHAPRLTGRLSLVANSERTYEFLALRFTPEQEQDQLASIIERATQILTRSNSGVTGLNPHMAHISIARRPYVGQHSDYDKIEKLQDAVVAFSDLHVRVGTSTYEFPIDSHELRVK